MFFVADFADGQIDPLGLHAGFCGGGFHALDGLGDYFQADVVAQYPVGEACAAGIPVVTGPHMFNFADATRQAVKAGAAIQTASTAQAVVQAQALLADPEARKQMGEAGAAFAARHRGATALHVEACLRLLGARV